MEERQVAEQQQAANGVLKWTAAASNTQEAAGFWSFYYHHFLAEHRHPLNVALHVLGTLSGLGLIVWVLLNSTTAVGRNLGGTAPAALTSLAWILLFPAVHALPGLLGHRMFERSTAVGDIRVFRRDFPPLWFLYGNHVMTVNILLGKHRPFPGSR